MKFKVTIRERIVQYATKTFEAATEQEARQMAEAEVWTTESGWEEGRGDTVECGVEYVEVEP